MVSSFFFLFFLFRQFPNTVRFKALSSASYKKTFVSKRFYFLCFSCYSSYTPLRDWVIFYHELNIHQESKVSYALTRFNWAKKQMQNCFCGKCDEHKSQDVKILFSVLVLTSNLSLMTCHWVHLHTFLKRNTSFL